MGLIKAAAGAIGSTLGDQWKEAIRCPDMGNEILMKKVTTPTGVISNGSTIIVGPGQCAIIYDNGRVLDASAEEGFYTFDSSSTPSLFAGQFGDMFKEMWTRFTYNGATSKQQAVFFFNTKQIIKNPFGTKNPIPFQDWSHAIKNEIMGEIMPLLVKVKCFGTYVFRISDPSLFMQEIAGTADVYKKDELLEQIRSEVLSVFQNVVNELGNSENKVPIGEMPSQTDEIEAMLKERSYDQGLREKGLKITTFSVESVILDEESEKAINEYEHNANSRMQQGRILDVMEKAASNESGAVNGFLGIGMANMAGGNMFGGVMNNAFNPNNAQVPPQPAAPQGEQLNTTAATSTPVAAPSGTVCSNCGQPVVGKFCANCGTPVASSEPQKKFCTNCGAEVTGNFCTNCGTKA